MFQALWRLLELGIEAAVAESRQGRFYAVDDGGVLANEGLALAVGALGILLREGRDRPAGLEGDRNTIDLVSGLLRFCSPSLEKF